MFRELYRGPWIGWCGAWVYIPSCYPQRPHLIVDVLWIMLEAWVAVDLAVPSKSAPKFKSIVLFFWVAIHFSLSERMNSNLFHFPTNPHYISNVLIFLKKIILWQPSLHTLCKVKPHPTSSLTIWKKANKHSNLSWFLPLIIWRNVFASIVEFWILFLLFNYLQLTISLQDWYYDIYVGWRSTNFYFPSPATWFIDYFMTITSLPTSKIWNLRWLSSLHIR